MNDDNEFLTAFRGRFTSLLRWHQLDDFWKVLQDQRSDHWYVYAIGEPPPTEPLSWDAFVRFLGELDALLRKEHQEDYCGVVYADDLQAPGFVKIYDPNNLGVVCGSSNSPPLPGWTLSKLKPVDLKAAISPPGNRRRWWQRLFSEDRGV
jgi:hypothetical protein